MSGDQDQYVVEMKGGGAGTPDGPGTPGYVKITRMSGGGVMSPEQALRGAVVQFGADDHDDLHGRRVTTPDYGRGRVVAVLPIGVQVWYDLPLTGTVDTHMLVHDPSYVVRWLDQ